MYGALTEVPLLRRANCIQPLTEKEARQVGEYGIDVPTEIIPNGIDERVLARDWSPDPTYFGLTEDCLTLLFLSRIHPKKGLDLMLLAAQMVGAGNTGMRIIIAGGDAGSGYLETIKAECARRGLCDMFRFLGESKGDEKLAALSAADVFILPSYSEGLPIAVLEALGSDLPVVVTDECNLPEDGEQRAEFVVPPDPSHIADAVREIFSLSSNERRAMGIAARTLAADLVAWKQIASRTISWYRRILDFREKCVTDLP